MTSPPSLHLDRGFARRIDLTSLQLFVAVCELGSIGRAAEREFIAASAISKRLSDLESTLGIGLLYRHARGVDLTPAGESLLHHARAMLYSLEKMQGELSEYAEGVRGHVRVHANISAIVQYLPEDLGAFARLHEGIKIDLEEHLSHEVVRAVQAGAADLGICHVPEGDAGELQTLPYRRDQLALVLLQPHPLAGRASLAFAETLDEDHVGLHTHSSIYRAMHGAATTEGRSVRLRIHVTGLDAMCRMIDNGLGVGVMPRRAFELMRAGIGSRLAAVDLSDDWARREIRLVARDFSTLPVAARTLVQHLRPAEPAEAAPPAATAAA
ncbi:LysR substrate-binding domain-containing protein [uncultured Pseudacidovorax sp.]|uniref:LysR substrate-binding domain-containing protein n=1 Tax=uncultured Pseudacidovorax sp. TaxID=679313 RepID=UPI0025DA22F2|nr:LysR substrate-binding domain-containing protein [uncultured Pseudacidovorax sp.]